VLGWHFNPRPGTVGLAPRHSGPAGPCQPMLCARVQRGHRGVATRTTAWPAQLRRWPRCSARGGDSPRERWQWSRENGLARRHSMAAAELWWPGRASMNPAAGGWDMGGEARSKRGRRRECGRAHRGGERMVRRREDGSPVGWRGHEARERDEGVTKCLAHAREGGQGGKGKKGGWRQRALYRRHGGAVWPAAAQPWHTREVRATIVETGVRRH
jgi:hypothetical protein